ncbi:MAG: pyridoxamine 5'-phosphate oxidase family protein [Pseudomonadales bacterium]|nr:pyridoxamine 5'-phosphate oxidase family protein [Pseudomonadales bacterium]
MANMTLTRMKLMNPLEKLTRDRQSARSHEDSNADICFLSLSQDGVPSVRTLVMRDVTQEGITLFINKTSHKWQIIQSNECAEALVWLPSVQRQYRVSGRIEELGREVIESNWHRRPVGSKYLDYSYERLAPQSSELEARDSLVQFVRGLKDEIDEDDMSTPEQAAGILLRANAVECLDLNSPERLHDRNRYTLENGSWQQTVLMP